MQLIFDAPGLAMGLQPRMPRAEAIVTAVRLIRAGIRTDTVMGRRYRAQALWAARKKVRGSLRAQVSLFTRGLLQGQTIHELATGRP